MNKPVVRTALFYAILAGGFILIDLALDRLIGGTPELNLPHLIFASLVVPTSFLVLSHAIETRRRAEDVLRQARDEMQVRVQERTAELERANAVLQAEIVERKQAERARARSEAKIVYLSSFPQVNPNPILEVDAAGTITFCNSATAETLQRLGMEDDARAFFPDDLAVILRELEQTKETQFYREVQVGNAIFGATVHLVPVFNAARIYIFDITEHKRAEQDLRHALAESQQRQAEVSALLAGSRAVLEQGEFEKAARSIFNACKNLLGATGGYVALITEDSTQSRPVFLDPGGLPCLVDPSLPMPIRGLREQAYRTGLAVYENDLPHSEWIHLLPEGHVFLDNVLFAPLTINGIVVGLLGLANKTGGFNENDVRLASAFAELATVALVNKRTLELLQNSEERFRSVLQATNDAIITSDSHGNIVFWNCAAERIFGFSAVEMVGQSFTCVMPHHIRQAHEDDMRRALVAGQSAMIGRIIESTGLKKDGSEFSIELSLASWNTREGHFFTSTIRDITERKLSEAALRQAQADLAQHIQEQIVLEERQRLARELHDSVSQALYGISLGAHTALAVFEGDRAKVIAALNYVLSLAEAGLTEMRALIFELRPESLETEGLIVGLNKQAVAVRARHSIEVKLDLCDEPGVSLAVKEALYRIAQEAMQNAVKHARPTRLDVRLMREPDSLRLEVCDNGAGFDPLVAYPGHLGLRSMRERAKSVGGTLDIESTPDCGTQIRARIPVPVAQLA